MKAPLFALALALASSSAASASTIILTNPTGSNPASSDSTRGFAFDTSIAFTVTHLAFYDFGGDGLGASHEVGLWDPSGTLLVSAVVGSGTSAPLSEDGLWRMVDIEDFVIPAASGYVVAASFTANSDHQFSNAPGTINGITYVGGRGINNNTSVLTYPTSTFSVGYGGGGLAVAVPEPSVTLLAVAGMLGLIRRRR